MGVIARNFRTAFRNNPDLIISIVDRITVNNAQLENSSGETACTSKMKEAAPRNTSENRCRKV
jgi:hypothetical protein